MIWTGEPVVTASARDDTRMSDHVSVHQLMLQSVAARAKLEELLGHRTAQLAATPRDLVQALQGEVRARRAHPGRAEGG